MHTRNIIEVLFEKYGRHCLLIGTCTVEVTRDNWDSFIGCFHPRPFVYRAFLSQFRKRHSSEGFGEGLSPWLLKVFEMVIWALS